MITILVAIFQHFSEVNRSERVWAEAKASNVEFDNGWEKINSSETL